MLKKRVQHVRNPVYIFLGLGSLLLFLLTALLASRSTVSVFERAVFDLFYSLPDFLRPFAIGLTIIGAVIFPIILGIYFVARRRADVALRIVSAALLSFVLARLAEAWIQRPVPNELIGGVTERVSLPFTGFPSHYAAVAIATGLVLAVYLPRSYRRWTNLAFISVGCSQLYLGVSLPLDVIAGWLVGLFSYSAIALAIGSRYAPINPDKLAQKLVKGGLAGVKLKPASVDARGSVPFFGEYEGGKIFVKVFSQDNNAADWLFKLIRRVQYRRLEDEVPSLTPKRAIEHEAYLTMLAIYTAKVRVPEFLGMFKVGRNSYAMALKRLDAEGLDGIKPSKITDQMLDGIWKQITMLHKSRIIHKDLRAANVMIEKKTGLPWIIDFGFSESAIDPKSFYKDNVEFIASSSTIIGAKRAVNAALNALDKEGLAKALPFMQYAALSGATTTSLKNKPGLLEEVRVEMSRTAGINGDVNKKAKISRLSIKRK